MSAMFLKRLRRAGRERVLGALGLPCGTHADACHREQMYYRAFLDLKSHLGITEPFYPFGGAANGSLLYILARAVTSLPVTSICEMGCGQSTLLLDALAGCRGAFRATSIEHNEFWVEQICSQLQRHDRIRLMRRELTEQTVRGHKCRFYDLPCLQGQSFDLLLIDGPNGERRRSRWGSLQLIDKHLKEEFLVVFDDAERLGEEDTYREAVKLLREKGIPIHTEMIRAQKSQFLIASPGMRAACFF